MTSETTIVKRHMEQLLFDVKRGFLQFVVLSLIYKGPKYAYEIKEDVYRVTAGAFAIDLNNLYKKLRTLEQDGILRSFEKSSDKGANRKYYTLTPFGKKFFKEVFCLMQPVIDSFHERMEDIPLS